MTASSTVHYDDGGGRRVVRLPDSLFPRREKDGKKKGRGSRHRNRRPRPISATIITGRDTVCLPPIMKGAHRRTGDGLNFLAKETPPRSSASVRRRDSRLPGKSDRHREERAADVSIGRTPTGA